MIRQPNTTFARVFVESNYFLTVFELMICSIVVLANLLLFVSYNKMISNTPRATNIGAVRMRDSYVGKLKYVQKLLRAIQMPLDAARKKIVLSKPSLSRLPDVK